MKNILFIFGLLALILLRSCSSSREEKLPPEERIKWWTDAKFGMFIHWGVYSVPAGYYQGKPVQGNGEWIMHRAKIPVEEYRKFADDFNPVRYDPEAWVKMAKEAGMKYIVITSKHHDGFALFDSKVTDWDIVDATPYGKDLIKPLARACKREGIKLGFYYSQAQDWNHPGGAASGGRWDPTQEGDMDKYLDSISVPQVREILSKYGKIDILWWDTPTDMNPSRAEKFLPILEQYPNMITNNRLGGGISGDSETPEQFVPSTGYPGRHWEVCMTMNDTWGFKKDDNNWKSSRDILLKLADIVSKGGNFLLNVGPTPEGEIPQASIERLRDVGKWMKTNSESIYGTGPSPFPYLPWGKATRKGQKLYFHVGSWPEGGILKVPLINKVTKAYLLSAPEIPLVVSQNDQRVEITLPQQPEESILPVFVAEFEGEPNVLPIPTAGKIPSVSSVDSTASASNLCDGNPKNVWKPVAGENKAWVEIDLGEEITISNMAVAEPWHPWNNRGQEFVLQVKSGDEWTDILSGKTPGCGYSQDFEPVPGRYFRLLITGSGNQVPVLNEWILNRAI